MNPIVLEARKLVGTRYHHQAYRAGVGCDCIGVIICVGLTFGFWGMREFLADPVYSGYGRQPDEAKLTAAANKYLLPIPIADMSLGDIPLMVYDKAPQHFGIISGLSPHYLIHAYAQNKKVIENNIDESGHRRIVGCYRYRTCPPA